MDPYNHDKIEKKWQKVWESKKPNKVKEDPSKKKFFGLIEFPFPSGDGLHVGHIRSNTAMDIIARKRRREGYNVLYPIGWDAFGLPTENYAIKTGMQPSVVSKKNSDTFRRQLKALGFSFDWSREIDTTDPKYYKWTQWIFLQFLKKGLAYKKKLTINWCPKDLIGLANEEVVDGCCERCGTKVEQKEKEQWMLAITKYADRLDKDLDETDFLEKIKIQQRNWIGKSEGAEIEFPIKGSPKKIKVFTTRPDTLFGVTYVVLAPEHSYVQEFINNAENTIEIAQYIKSVREKTDIERTDAKAAKSGVELKGIKAINPVNNEEVPVWIADYVLADYGTGAVMAVPAHDERDFDFAKKYGLEIREVVEPLIVERTAADAVRPELPLKERNAVVCVIKHWSEDKYLGLRWKKNGWCGFVVGGIEKGEEAKDAALREVKEETGYQNIEFVKTLGGIVHAQFYHMVKNENRFGHFQPVVLQLKDGEKVEISEEENALHEIVWLTAKEFDGFVNKEDMRIMWHRSRGKECYEESGLLTNSAQFDGKESEVIKKEITEFAGGTWVTKFKLRDWIFSRQRYWGEPIPVVHCIKCGIVPIPEKNLPVELPKVKNYAPTENGESPLASIEKWVNTKCPNCLANKKKTKYLIFDFDGVLGDTWNQSLTAKVAMGDSPSVEEAGSKAMSYFDKKPSDSRNHTLTAEQLEKKKQWIRTFGKHLAETKFGLFQGFVDQLKKIKNAQFAVVSAGSSQYVLPALEKSGLKFTHVLTYEDHHSKAQKVEKVCKDWGIDISEAYYFTDTKADILELEGVVNRENIIGCAWGWHGYDRLRELLPENKILKEFSDIRKVLNLDCLAKRETDTMPNWAGSSWYYLRYTDPNNKKAFADAKNLKYWTPVDWYNGGMEHTTLHLLYSRFWHKFLFDLGLVPTSEPYKKRTSHGLILAEGGEKMSKSKGNVINPDSIIKTVGADTLRIHEMFMGPFDQAIAWDTNTIAGSRRFIERVWKLQEKVSTQAGTEKAEVLMHKTIKKVSDDIEDMKFNTAISAMMIAINELEKEQNISKDHYGILVQLLAPFAPHVSEELWTILGNKTSIHSASWPIYDEKKMIESTVTMTIQISGKMRGTLECPANSDDTFVQKTALEKPEIKKWIEGKDIKKVIIIKNKLINIVVG